MVSISSVWPEYSNLALNSSTADKGLILQLYESDWFFN